MIIEHQFLHSEYFFPNWKVNILFIGTFNPICGEQLDYYYRRSSNGFWKILKHYDENEIYNFTDFNHLKSFMIDNKFGCVDVIRSVSFPDVDRPKICGKGYTDNNLFKTKLYSREYNFEQIKKFILDNKVKNVFTTWGCRDNPKEFRNLLIDFQSFCDTNRILYVQLISPSGRMYKGDNINNINVNWWTNLDRHL